MNRARHEESYVAYVTARRSHLWRIAYAVCGDRHAADDLLQTALTKLYVAWPRLHRDGSEDAYVRRIIVRANIDVSRRPSRREHPVAEHRDVAGPAGSPEDRSVLMAALQGLPVMQRKVVVLRHWLGLSVAETADELGIAPGTVKSHGARGLAALQAVLADDRC